MALAPWRRPRAVHDPGKILLDVALAVALSGDCLADVLMLQAKPAVFGPVASDSTVSRLIDKLAAGGHRTLTAIRTARAEVREQGLEAGRRIDAGRGRPGDRGPGRGAGPSPLRGAGRRCDLEEVLRTSSADGLRRPRTRRHRGAGGRAATARERGQQHRCRPRDCHPTRPGPAPETSPAPPVRTDSYGFREQHS